MDCRFDDELKARLIVWDDELLADRASVVPDDLSEGEKKRW